MVVEGKSEVGKARKKVRNVTSSRRRKPFSLRREGDEKTVLPYKTKEAGAQRRAPESEEKHFIGSGKIFQTEVPFNISFEVSIIRNRSERGRKEQTSEFALRGGGKKSEKKECSWRE